jgi:hypothetical protein
VSDVDRCYWCGKEGHQMGSCPLLKPKGGRSVSDWGERKGVLVDIGWGPGFSPPDGLLRCASCGYLSTLAEWDKRHYTCPACAHEVPVDRKKKT